MRRLDSVGSLLDGAASLYALIRGLLSKLTRDATASESNVGKSESSSSNGKEAGSSSCWWRHFSAVNCLATSVQYLLSELGSHVVVVVLYWYISRRRWTRTNVALNARLASLYAPFPKTRFCHGGWQQFLVSSFEARNTSWKEKSLVLGDVHDELYHPFNSLSTESGAR